jgi:acylphosphatase
MLHDDDLKDKPIYPDLPSNLVVQKYVLLRGRVIGVGLRLKVEERASELGLSGACRNRNHDRTVELFLSGPEGLIANFLEELSSLKSSDLLECNVTTVQVQDPWDEGFLWPDGVPDDMFIVLYPPTLEGQVEESNIRTEAIVTIGKILIQGQQTMIKKLDKLDKLDHIAEDVRVIRERGE